MNYKKAIKVLNLSLITIGQAKKTIENILLKIKYRYKTRKIQ